MDDSDSSALSSPPSSDDEQILLNFPNGGASAMAVDGRESSSPAPPMPRPKRPASPPHEEVLADNPDIAFIVMFRSRFNNAFPPKLPQFGPQDIEKGVVDSLPSQQVENLLCAILGLVLNRKKYIERGHHGRALEEAIQTQKHQWPRAWNGTNPLQGGKTFNTMNPQERLTLLKTLLLWSLHASDAISGMIKESYKQSRHEDDLNQPLSVQPWGRDGDKRRYWLIEGTDDTSFRLYRESNPALKKVTWWSVGGSIDDLRTIAQKLSDEGSQAARRLSERILTSVPRFEATEEKRKRREYRLARKAQFSRPEPGFSLYEGRTRGKRMKYTFSDDEDETSDAVSVRRSTRQSGQETPADPSRPTVTASGRQVRSRVGGLYGESLLSGQAPPDQGEDLDPEASDEAMLSKGRSTRSGGRHTANGWVSRSNRANSYNSAGESDATSSGNEWDGGDEDENDDLDDDERMSDVSDNELENAPKESLVVRLRYRKGQSVGDTSMTDSNDEIVVKPAQYSTASLDIRGRGDNHAADALPNDIDAQHTITGAPDSAFGPPQPFTPVSSNAPSLLSGQTGQGAQSLLSGNTNFSQVSSLPAPSDSAFPTPPDLPIVKPDDAHHISQQPSPQPPLPLLGQSWQ